MIELSIIIVNWNAESVLKSCLNSIYKFTKSSSFEIIVVDNNSTDNSCRMIEENFKEVILIKNSENYGFAAANNQGLEICKGENILLLNPDTELKDDAINGLVSFLKTSSFDIVTCKLLNTDGSLQRSVYKFHSSVRTILENRLINLIKLFKLNEESFGWISKLWAHDEIKQIDWARGAVMLLSRKVFTSLGYLDENCFIYAEEIDYYMRARKAGFTAGFTPKVSIVHHAGISTQQVKLKMLLQNHKSYSYLINKHYSKRVYYFYKLAIILGLLFKIMKVRLSANKEQYDNNLYLLKYHLRSKNG